LIDNSIDRERGWAESHDQGREATPVREVTNPIVTDRELITGERRRREKTGKGHGRVRVSGVEGVTTTGIDVTACVPAYHSGRGT